MEATWWKVRTGSCDLHAGVAQVLNGAQLLVIKADIKRPQLLTWLYEGLLLLNPKHKVCQPDCPVQASV